MKYPAVNDMTGTMDRMDRSIHKTYSTCATDHWDGSIVPISLTVFEKLVNRMSRIVQSFPHAREEFLHNQKI